MEKYNPPISERNTEELLEIIYSGSDVWQLDAINQAKTEIKKRDVSESDQLRVFEAWEHDDEEYLILFRKQEAIRLKNNEKKSYKPYQMLLLFIFGPYAFFTPNSFSMGLFELRNENFKLKYKQRLIILILSFISWVAYFNYSIKESERKRMEEIEKIDISDWEKQHGYDE